MRTLVVCVLAAVAFLAGCGGPAASSGGPSTSNTFTADAKDVVAAFTAAGLPADNPRENSANCGGIGCDQYLTTDNITIVVFPDEETASLFAGVSTDNSYRRGRVVLSYLAARTPGDQQSRYEEVLEGLG